MKRATHIHLQDVQAVYSGPEGELWELIMGEQVHLGGFQSSMDLAEKAGIGPGLRGVDLCCCTGAGMRFLVRFRQVDRMTGVDATAKVVERGRDCCAAQGLADRIDFVLADACQSGLPTASADFVWGEDAWCYVEDKARLIAEAVRIVKPRGTIAFTDWVEGTPPLAEAEAARFLKFMKFPNFAGMGDYCRMLETNGCKVLRSDNTGQFTPSIELYLEMLGKQLTYDALRILGFDTTLLAAMGEEMKFIQQLARTGKIVQGLFVARKA